MTLPFLNLESSLTIHLAGTQANFNSSPRVSQQPIRFLALSVTSFSPLLMQSYLLFAILWYLWDISLVCKSPFLSRPCGFLTLGLCRTPILQAFTLLPSKKEKFLTLIKNTLSSSQIELLTLQKLPGKCISMSLAVPTARLFTNAGTAQREGLGGGGALAPLFMQKINKT